MSPIIRTRGVLDHGKFSSTAYGKVAFLYDFLDRISGDACEKTRNLFLGRFTQCRNALEVGSGTGRFAALFAAKDNPGELTLNDLSGEMLERAQLKLAASGWKGRCYLLPGDITRMETDQKFDVVILHFVLNMFPVGDRKEFLERCAGFLSEDGTLWVSDFLRPKYFWPCLISQLNWWIAVVLFWALARNRPNALGDLEKVWEGREWIVLDKKTILGGIYGSYLLQRRHREKPASARDAFRPPP